MTPERIGSYRIQKVLGRGGMGVVYRGEHVESGRPAAIKTITSARESALHGIRREIAALAALEHPGIVRILEHGLDGGNPYCVLELLEGKTLGRWFRGLVGSEVWPLETIESVGEATAAQTPLTDTGVREREELFDFSIRPLAAGGRLPEVLTLVRRLCSALAFLHGEGIVHRDLKQENILVRPDGNPVLIDFGITAQFASTDGREHLDVEDNVILGTPPYIAPEHIVGDVLDARADLYSLGCVLYELVAGRTPFLGGDTRELLRKHVYETPEPASKFVAGIPDDLDRLLLSMLAKKPKDRIGHAEDVGRVLGQLGGGDAPAWPRPRTYLYRPGLAGRAEMRASLEARVEELAGGHGGVIFLEGESGAGKTRLAAEIGRRAERKKVRVLTGECLDRDRARGLAPFRAVFVALADRWREHAAAAEAIRDELRVLLPFAPALGELPGLRERPAPPELPPEAARLRLLRALAKVLEAASREEPLLVILDDLQWADELTLSALAAALDRGWFDDEKILVLGTYRREEADEALIKLATRPRARRIEVTRLDDHAVAAMAEDMLALPDVPPAFAAFLTSSSQGNPFFVAEYLRVIIDQSLLVRRADGRWSFAGGASLLDGRLEAMPLPGSIRALAERRLDGLSSAATALLQLAAVVGRESEAAFLERLFGQGAAAFDAAAGELLRRHVLEDVDGRHLRFAHDKLREVAESALESGLAATLHGRVAIALEARGDAPAATLAHHFDLAGNDTRARPLYLAAAEQAVASWSLGEAERLFRAHLRLASAPDRDAVRARNALARDVLWTQGRYREAIEQHQAALGAAEQIGDALGRARALHGLSTVQRVSGQLQVARATALEALGAARALADRALEGAVLTTLAAADLALGELNVAQNHFEEALAIEIEIGGNDLEAVIRSNLAIIDRECGRVQAARQQQDEALAIHRQRTNLRSEGITLAQIALLEADQGYTEAARNKFEESLTVLRTVGDRGYEGQVLAALAGLEAESGGEARALRRFDEAEALLVEVGDPLAIAEADVDRARLMRRMKFAPEAIATRLARAEAAFGPQASPLRRIPLLVELGHLAKLRGEDAGSALAEAVELAKRVGAPPTSRLGRRIAELEKALGV